MTRVYIAGPIKDTPGAINNFSKAAEYLKRKGHTPISPIGILPWNHDGPCPTTYSAGEGSEHDAACYLRSDLAALLWCDAIFMLRGWEKSRGASAELFVAQTIGIPITFQAAS